MLGIVIVNYKSFHDTVSYIKKQIIKINIPHKIVVINVACDDYTNIALTKSLEAYFVDDIESKIDKSANIFILSDKNNLGYAKGNNLGAKFLLNHYSSINYLLFSNNDIEIIDCNVVNYLIEKAESNSRIGAIGPKIIGLNGVSQGPWGKISIWRGMIIPNILSPFYAVFPSLRNFINKKIPSNVSGVVYWVSGCFVLVKSADFRSVGGFDPFTFLYAEEKILAERLLSYDKVMYYLSETEIIHAHGTTIKNNIDLRTVENISFNSNIYYYRKYQNVSNISIAIAFAVHKLFINITLPLKNLLKDVFRSGKNY